MAKAGSFSVGFPSVDRPFGVHLWPFFSRAYESVMSYPAEQFKFGRGTTFMSTLPEVVVAIVAYYVIIFGGRTVMKSFKPIHLNLLFQIHNVVLTVVSLGLLLLFIEQLAPILIRHGLFFAICDTRSWTPEIVVLYYLNYLTKYLELLDTVFLFLKKKPLTFLHCYHHGATALLCFTQLIGHTSVSWVPITLNLGVHVIMYWYYFLSARGIRVWWKEWVTRTQIIQFVIDLFFVYFAAYTYFASTYFSYMPNHGSCAGEEFAAIYGCALLTSYLFLFMAFYASVYKKKGKRAARRALSDGAIAIDPKFSQEALDSLQKRGSKAATPTPPPEQASSSSVGRTAPPTRSRKI